MRREERERAKAEAESACPECNNLMCNGQGCSPGAVEKLENALEAEAEVKTEAEVVNG